MDAALQELGSGVKPDDSPLWGQAYPVPVKGKSRDTRSYQEMSRPYSIGISSIDRKTQPYSGGQVWAAPTYHFLSADAWLVCKKFEMCIEINKLAIL